MKKAWDDVYQISTMSAQTLRDNAAKFCKYNSSLKFIKVRYGNDVKPKVIHIRAIETIIIQENVQNNEKNEEEIMENINEEENEETRIMRLTFEEILHTLTACKGKY